MIFNWTNMLLRNRIFSSFLVALLPVLLCIIAAIELFLVPAIGNNARQELTNSTRLLKSSIETGATVSVRNHLRAIAEKNREIVRYHLALAKQGVLTEEEALERIKAILLSQQIGRSGYIYVVDSQGNAVIHPNAEVEGTDNTRFAFVRDQMKRKEGYIEYEWRNPGEQETRSKALYMVYLKSLDWILSVSSYRDEFKELVNIDDFRDMVLSLQFGKSGYAYVVNQQGDTIIHPKIKNFNALRQNDIPSAFLQTMLDTGSGSLEYKWRNPDETELRDKIAVYENIPEYGWILVSSSYLDEIMGPVRMARIIAYLSTIVLLAAAALVSYYLSGRISKPVAAMIRQLDENAQNETHEPLPVVTSDELGRLAAEFNIFLKTLETKTKELHQEKERYRSLFETSPDAVFLIRGTTIIDCNSSTLAIFAGDSESIINNSVVDLSPPLQNGGISSEELARALTKGAASNPDVMQTFEWIHRRTDGRLFDAEVRLKRFGMEDDEALLVAFVRDITSRKEAENALRQSEMKYRHLLENADDAIFIAQHGMIVFGNSKTSALMGYSPEELKKLPLGQIIHQKDRKMVEDRHIRRVQGDSELPTTYSFVLVTKSGAERLVLLSTMVIEWENQPATLNFVRDITDQKKLEDFLQQAQKMEAIGTLAGGIAHDFNNILMGIQGRVSLMSVEQQNSTMQEHLAAIDAHVQSAASLTRQLLGFARGGKYQAKATDLNDLVRSSAEMFGRTKKEMEVIIETSENPVVSNVDRRQIDQVLLNMYVNAWQAMPGGGKLYLATSIVSLDQRQCRAHNKQPGSYAKITVTDTGNGIEESIQSQIFDPFFTTKEKERGTGLGLASAYGIISNHNGFITVYSEVHRGTTFNIYLPATEDMPETNPLQKTKLESGNETILLIDDEEIILEVSRAMLEQLGYKVISARSGKIAIDCLQQADEKIDLIILDLVMPGMDGAATFEQIRTIDPSIPVILSSGYAMNDTAKKVIQKGCDAFIQKPFSLNELSELLRCVLGGQKKADTAQNV